jgi:hypothetical protein
VSLPGCRGAGAIDEAPTAAVELRRDFRRERERLRMTHGRSRQIGAYWLPTGTKVGGTHRGMKRLAKRCRAIRAISLALFWAPSALAAQEDLRCSWEPTNTGFGKPFDENVSAAALFFDQDHPLRMMIDLPSSSVAFPSDVDQLVLGAGSVSQLDDDVRIQFENPKMKGLEGIRSRLPITIDRYDLSSILILSTWDEQDSRHYGRWLRQGSCKRRGL